MCLDEENHCFSRYYWRLYSLLLSLWSLRPERAAADNCRGLASFEFYLGSRFDLQPCSNRHGGWIGDARSNYNANTRVALQGWLLYRQRRRRSMGLCAGQSGHFEWENY